MARVSPLDKLFRPKRCERCGKTLPRTKRGRPRLFCSRNCRQRAYEDRRAGASPRVAAMRPEVLRTLDQAEVKRLLRELLIEEGVIPPARPTPRAKPRKPGPKLRLVSSRDDNGSEKSEE